MYFVTWCWHYGTVSLAKSCFCLLAYNTFVHWFEYSNPELDKRALDVIVMYRQLASTYRSETETSEP